MDKTNVKEEMIKMLEALPEDCTWEGIQYHIYVREKVERGMAAANAGDVISQEEAEKKVEEWLKIVWTGPALRDLEVITKYIAMDSPR